MFEALFKGLSQSLEKNCFSRIVHSLVDALVEKGVSIDRMQGPRSKLSGPRHPLYGLIILTYKHEKVHTEKVPHAVFSKRERLR